MLKKASVLKLFETTRSNNNKNIMWNSHNILILNTIFNVLPQMSGPQSLFNY